MWIVLGGMSLRLACQMKLYIIYCRFKFLDFDKYSCYAAKFSRNQSVFETQFLNQEMSYKEPLREYFFIGYS